jgi:hypothetical protein
MVEEKPSRSLPTWVIYLLVVLAVIGAPLVYIGLTYGWQYLPAVLTVSVIAIIAGLFFST